MLVAALALTVLGFAFLIAAVATGQVLWAWACIVVGAAGLLVLIIDVIRGRSRRDDAHHDDAHHGGPSSSPPAETATDSTSVRGGHPPKE